MLPKIVVDAALIAPLALEIVLLMGDSEEVRECSSCLTVNAIFERKGMALAVAKSLA